VPVVLPLPVAQLSYSTLQYHSLLLSYSHLHKLRENKQKVHPEKKTFFDSCVFYLLKEKGGSGRGSRIIKHANVDYGLVLLLAYQPLKLNCIRPSVPAAHLTGSI